jgi:hypothetical protein
VAEESSAMTRKVPLDRLRELAKHRSITEPLGVSDEPIQLIDAEAEPDILIWPIPRSTSPLPN